MSKNLSALLSQLKGSSPLNVGNSILFRHSFCSSPLFPFPPFSFSRTTWCLLSFTELSSELPSGGLTCVPKTLIICCKSRRTAADSAFIPSIVISIASSLTTVSFSIFVYFSQNLDPAGRTKLIGFLLKKSYLSLNHSRKQYRECV
ncbi:hypothetical protein LR48_Vigan09g179800 [Vigna angularis]|uniref:Uncharacterized protein n=1 Tax=Phaseolus angularis TaxID=3914 RepID=A0A0L9VEM1_PHAAN|nr:hypothetical protein LR48_Vigan09g179800 [Vigna angularis]